MKNREKTYKKVLKDHLIWNYVIFLRKLKIYLKDVKLRRIKMCKKMDFNDYLLQNYVIIQINLKICLKSAFSNIESVWCYLELKKWSKKFCNILLQITVINCYK